ncbi:hypothetical protein D3C81_2046540 [compost metagenome]
MTLRLIDFLLSLLNQLINRWIVITNYAIGFVTSIGCKIKTWFNIVISRKNSNVMLTLLNLID